MKSTGAQVKQDPRIYRVGRWKKAPTAQEVPHQQGACPLPGPAPPIRPPATPWGGGRRERGGRERRRKGASKAKASQDTPWIHTELVTSPKQLNPPHQPAQVSLSNPHPYQESPARQTLGLLLLTSRLHSQPASSSSTHCWSPKCLLPLNSSTAPLDHLSFQLPYLLQIYPTTLLSVLTPVHIFQDINIPDPVMLLPIFHLCSLKHSFISQNLTSAPNSIFTHPTLSLSPNSPPKLILPPISAPQALVCFTPSLLLPKILSLTPKPVSVL